jgi:hypothetical protein
LLITTKSRNDSAVHFFSFSFSSWCFLYSYPSTILFVSKTVMTNVFNALAVLAVLWRLSTFKWRGLGNLVRSTVIYLACTLFSLTCVLSHSHFEQVLSVHLVTGSASISILIIFTLTATAGRNLSDGGSDPSRGSRVASNEPRKGHPLPGSVTWSDDRGSVGARGLEPPSCLLVF